MNDVSDEKMMGDQPAEEQGFVSFVRNLLNNEAFQASAKKEMRKIKNMKVDKNKELDVEYPITEISSENDNTDENSYYYNYY